MEKQILAPDVWQPKIGDRVMHEKEGPGTAIDHDGTDFCPWLVKFDNGFTGKNGHGRFCTIRLLSPLRDDMAPTKPADARPE